ncbi:MAG TPA: diacylglycerol kinase family protein [Gemmatimonadaceae bacterium]|nr:diacylglycerol kinase family protein [Gemmatimonadaceae bacterium]
MAPETRIPAFVNPAAGGADAAIAVLGRHGGFAVEHVAPGEVARHVRDAVHRGARRILVAGGDGTIGAAASAMCGEECELAVLPAGTLNHLAQDLGLPEDLEEAARIAAGTNTTAIDVAEVNGRIFLNTSSVGAYVTFVRTREQLEPRLGYWLSSGIAALRILARLRSFRVTLEVDGMPREYVTPLVFVGVGERDLKLPHLGKRVPDGRSGLHVMVVRSRTGARVLALALAAAARGVRAVSHTPAMDSFIVQHVRIEPRRSLLAWRVSVDGEVVELTPPLEYRLRAAALKIVVE